MPAVFEPLDRLGRSTRVLLGAIFLLGSVALGVLSAGPPRLTLVNAAIAIDYPWTRGAAALGAALAFGLFAACVPRPRLRLLLLLLALLPTAVGLQLLLFRVEAADAGLSARGLLGSTSLAWKEITAVSLLGGSVLVQGRSGSIEIDTTDFSPEQRGVLERSIARHVGQGGTGRILTLPD